MRIERLELENFRLFEKKEFFFPRPFTVLIGENGRGKSAVLQGLRVAASAWLLGFNETERLHIEPEDVRRVELGRDFRPQFPAIVRSTGVVESQRISWARQRNDFKGGMGRTAWAEAKPLIELARRCEEDTNARLLDVPLPVLLYFSTARLWVGAKKPIEDKTKGSKLQDGYDQALTPEHKRRGTPGRNKALGWIKATYIEQLEEKTEDLAAALASLLDKNSQDTGVAGGQARKHLAGALLQAVLQAITTCVPDWEELRWDSTSNDLSGLYHRPDGSRERVPLYYLSDGLRTMAGMVAEIAYRCVMLNGHLGKDAVIDSKGLVLIDELDMHLHPNWQRRVVSDLKKAFPNLQFVVTTHSPFIVQSVSSDELVNLDYPSDVQPKDLRLEDVAVTVMDVDSPLSIEKQRAEDQAFTYLKRLHADDRATSAELAKLEDEVTDPGLRAILRMERLLKETQS